MSEPLVLRGTTVVDTRTGATTPSRDVVVVGNRIEAVLPADTRDASTSRARVVDARGTWLVPGFNDMHAHALESSDPSGTHELMLTFGVTGYRQMSGSPDLLRRRRDGALDTSTHAPALLATPGALLTPLNAATPDAIRATVREQAEQGADFIKMGMVAADVYPAGQEEANRIGIPFGGHLPTLTDSLEASAAGIRFIEHLGPGIGVIANCSADEERLRAELAAVPQPRIPTVRLPYMDKVFAAVLKRIVVSPMMRSSPEMVAVIEHAVDTFDEDRARAVAATFTANETWQSPTLIREKTNELGDDPAWATDPDLRYVSEKTLKLWRRTGEKFRALPESTLVVFHALYDVQLRLTKVLAEEGVPMIAGSDVTGASWEVPGASLHQEFDELARAGLSPLKVLQMTTLDAGRFLRLDDLGVVEAGALADLVLLGADPTTDISHLHCVTGVVRGGRHLSRADLDAIQERVSAQRSVR